MDGVLLKICCKVLPLGEICVILHLDMAKIRERYTERIASRLRDNRNCKILNLLGRDIRVGGTLKA